MNSASACAPPAPSAVNLLGRWHLPILFACALLACVLPWALGQGAGLSFNAYDLAEWTSLHPAVRASAPSLLLTLILRLPLAYLAAAAAALLKPRTLQMRATGLGFTLLLIIALLPPLEFWGPAHSDPNYQQQFGLAAVTLIVSLTAVIRRTRAVFVAVGSLLVAAACAWGLIEAGARMDELALSFQLGAGGVVFPVICLLIAYSAFKKMRQPRSRLPHVIDSEY